MGRTDEAVIVLVDQEGTPTLLRWREKDYQVSSRPVRWFARAEWWAGERAHRGIGSGAVEFEMWRVRATLEGSSKTFDLIDTKSGKWKLSKCFEQ